MPRNVEDLSLPEQILLLALQEEKGTVVWRAEMYPYAVGGAVLAELLLAGRIRIAEGFRKVVEAAGGAQSTGDPLLDDFLRRIATARWRRGASCWVSRFARTRGLKHRVAEGLCRKGVLGRAEYTLLFLITLRRYPTLDPEPRRRLVNEMREAMAGTDRAVEPRVAVVVAVTRAARMLGVHFRWRELRRWKARIREVETGAFTDEAHGALNRAALAALRTAVRNAVAARTAIRSSH